MFPLSVSICAKTRRCSAMISRQGIPTSLQKYQDQFETHLIHTLTSLRQLMEMVFPRDPDGRFKNRVISLRKQPSILAPRRYGRFSITNNFRKNYARRCNYRVVFMFSQLTGCLVLLDRLRV